MSESAVTEYALKYPDGELPFSVTPAVEGPDGLGIDKLLGQTGKVTYDIGFGNTAPARRRSRSSTATQGILRYRGYPIEELAENVHVPRDLVPVDLRRAADRRPAGRVRREDHAAHDAARGLQAVLRRLPPRRTPDGGALVGGQRAVDLLPGQPGPVRSRRGRDLHDPADRQDADDRRLRLQEARSASRSSTRTTRSTTSRTSCG